MPIIAPDFLPVPGGSSAPFQFSGSPGRQLYATLANGQRQSFGVASIPMPEAVARSGLYVGQFPPGLPADTYYLPVWVQAGLLPASTDRRYGWAEPGDGVVLVVDWSGSAIRSVSRLSDVLGGGSRPVALPAPQESVVVAQQILSSLYAAQAQLSTQAFASVTIDGQTTTFRSPAQVEASIDYWVRRVALLSGRRRRIRSM